MTKREMELVVLRHYIRAVRRGHFGTADDIADIIQELYGRLPWYDDKSVHYGEAVYKINVDSAEDLC